MEHWTSTEPVKLSVGWLNNSIKNWPELVGEEKLAFAMEEDRERASLFIKPKLGYI